MLELELVQKQVQVQVVGRSRQALSWPCGSRSRDCAREEGVSGGGRRSSLSAQEGTQEVQRRTGWVKYGRLASLCGCRGQPGVGAVSRLSGVRT